MWPPWVGGSSWSETSPSQGGHAGPPLQKIRHFQAGPRPPISTTTPAGATPAAVAVLDTWATGHRFDLMAAESWRH